MKEKTGIIIYGSTGSIGTQTLDVIRQLRGIKEYDVVALICNNNIELLEKQIEEFRPRYAVVLDEGKAAELTKRLEKSHGTVPGTRTTRVSGGVNNALRICRNAIDVQVVVVAAVGISGLLPTLSSLEGGKNVALANKESLVTAGALVMETARQHRVEVLPIDSEHSAIWQCLEPEIYSGSKAARRSVIWQLSTGQAENPINRIILTASGGPFRLMDKSALRDVTIDQALEHPTWKMGGRITIDSATLMNKGFESLEAAALFGVPLDRVAIWTHPTSIVHSFVEFKDNSVKAQLDHPDMRLPIQYAIAFPERLPNRLQQLDLTELTRQGKPLEFFETDMEKFKCLALAFQAGKVGGTMPAVLNAADEKAVSLFLEGKISFLEIPRLVETAMAEHSVLPRPGLSEILAADRWARGHVELQYNSTIANQRDSGRRIRV